MEGSPNARASRPADDLAERLSRAAEIVLAPSGTDVHLIAAVLAHSQSRRGLVTVMPNPVESGRGVERAVRGAAYADCPPFPGGTQGAADAGPFGTVLAVAL